MVTTKGVGFLAEEATARTVVLTDHGRPTAVVMSPAAFDDLERSLRGAAEQILLGVAALVADKPRADPERLISTRKDPRCAALMPRAKAPCIRRRGHAGAHRATP